MPGKGMFSKQQYPGNDNYEHLAEMCRRATAKDLRSPDERLKQAIVLAVNNHSAQNMVPAKVVCDILIRRLQMDKPHKQYLAVDLVRKVLTECAEKMRMYRPDLLNEVGRIACKAGKNGPIDAQRAARKVATEFLASQGPEGQHALMMAGGAHDANMAPYVTAPRPPQAFSPTADKGPMSPQSARGTTAQQDYIPTGNTIEDVRQLIELAHGHSEILEELITAGGPEGESNPLIQELWSKVNALKQVFPGLLERLSTDGSPEAEALMARALQASDVLDNCMELQNTVRKSQTTNTFSPAGTPSAAQAAAAGGAIGYPLGLSDPPASATAPPAPPSPVASVPSARQEVDLLGFDSNSSSLPALGTAANKPPAEDPFNFIDLAISSPPQPAAKGAATAAAAPDPFSANPFAQAPSAPQAAAPASTNPFADAAVPAAAPPASAPYGAPAASAPQAYAAPAGYGAQSQVNPFTNAFAPQQPTFPPAPAGYNPMMPQAQQPYGQLGMPPAGFPPQPLQMPGYPAQQPFGALPTGAPPPQYANPYSPQPPLPTPMYNGGFPSPSQGAANPFAPQMPGLPQAPPYPPPKKFTNAFDDLLSDVAAKPKNAPAPAPMAQPMMKSKTMTQRPTASSPASGAPSPVPRPSAPAASPQPAPAFPADPFDVLVAQNPHGVAPVSN